MCQNYIKPEKIHEKVSKTQLVYQLNFDKLQNDYLNQTLAFLKEVKINKITSFLRLLN